MAKTAKKQEETKKEIKIPVSLIIAGVMIVLFIAVALIVTNTKTTGSVIKQPEEPTQTQPEPEKLVETEPLKILSFLNKKDAYTGWLYSDAEKYLIAAKGVRDGSRVSICTGVSECDVQWWGTPVKGAKLMATMSRFTDTQNANDFFISMSSGKQGTQVKENCYVFDDNTAVCRHHNIAFTIVSEFGSSYYDNLQPVLKDFASKLYDEIDYWN